MATPAAVLSILVKADGIAKTQAQVSSLDKGLERTSKRGSQHMVALGRTAKWLAGGAAFGGAVLAVKSTTEAFYESQKVAKQTNAVLKSTGQVAGVSAKQVADLATALSKKTGVDDEAIQSGENLLLTFTKIHNETGRGNDIFNRATKTIVDMSAALGQDMKTSAIQVGKALNDPIKGVTALQRVGVSFTKDQKEQIKSLVEHGKTLDAQKVILRELNTEFGGSAAATATNMDRLKVTLGNLQESIGSVFVPILEKASGGLNRFVDGMMSGTGAGGRLVQILKDLGGWLAGAFTTAIQAASGWLHTHRDDLNAVAHAARNVGTAIQWAWEKVALPVVQRVLPAIKQIVTGTFTVIGGAVDVLAGILTGDFGRAWNGVKAIFTGAAKAVLGIVRAMTAPIREAAARIGAALKDTLEGAWDGIKSIFRGGVNAVIDFLNILIGAINKIPGVEIGKIKPIGGGDRPKQENLGQTGHLAKGGAFGRTGGFVNTPITLMGEDAPRYPEWVIPTNPAYRSRAKGLLGQAAMSLGMAGGGMYSQGEIMDLWTGQHGASQRRLIASAVAMAESGGNANATSANPAGGSNLGLWQIWSGNPGATLNPQGNARAAINLSRNGANWGLWEAFTNGAYKKFLGKGRAGGGLPGTGLPSVGDIVGKFPKPGDLPGVFQGLGKYVIGKATSYVKKQIGGLFQGQGNLGNKGTNSGLALGVQKAIDLATGMGWAYPSPGQLTGGQHVKGSLHYQGRAVDFGTAGHSPSQVMALWHALVDKFGLGGLNELFYDPAGRYIDAHRWVQGAIGGHGDHIHAGFRKGGKWLGSFKRGGITSAEGLAHLHANEAVIPLAKGGHTIGPRPIKGPSNARARRTGLIPYSGLGALPNIGLPGPSRSFGPTMITGPVADDADTQDNTAALEALTAAQEEANRLQDVANAIAAERVELEGKLADNQLKILALSAQGDQILGAVIAAVNGGIGGKTGLGFQSPSYAGGMARYR